jgi:chitodextrinase
VRNDPWQKYLTTVDKIERSTGYDFLSLLQTAFQDALEAGDHAPAARFALSGAPNEGSSLTFDASSTTDADLGRTDLGRTETLSYQWTFSDGVTATGPSVTRTFAKFGSYTATLTVTDAFGWPSTVSQTVNVADVAPVVASIPGATLITGEQYQTSGHFADPGLDSWSASVDYGDNSGIQPLSLSGSGFSLQHVYNAAGQFTVAVTVADDGGKQGSAVATVNVETPLAATQDLVSEVQSLAGGLAPTEAMTLTGGDAAPQLVQPLLASLNAAVKQIQAGKNGAASNELGAFINKVNAAAVTGRLGVATAQQMTSLATRIQRALALD